MYSYVCQYRILLTQRKKNRRIHARFLMWDFFTEIYHGGKENQEKKDMKNKDCLLKDV